MERPSRSALILVWYFRVARDVSNPHANLAFTVADPPPPEEAVKFGHCLRPDMSAEYGYRSPGPKYDLEGVFKHGKDKIGLSEVEAWGLRILSLDCPVLGALGLVGLENLRNP